MSVQTFLRLAGVSFWTWRDLQRGNTKPTDATLKKLEAAFGHARGPAPPQILKSYHAVVVSLLADRSGFSRAVLQEMDFSVQRPLNPQWLAASRLNMMAIYITAVELQVENATLGRALGCTRQNIKKARDRVEDMREDPAIDALISGVTALVTGRA